MIEAMYKDGARVFVEVGPGSTLAPLVEAVLGDRPHLAVSCDAAGTSGLAGWLRSLARLVVAGLPVRLERLTQGRARRLLDFQQMPAYEDLELPSPSAWLVNGSRSRPLLGPEPSRLGQANTISRPVPGPLPESSDSLKSPTKAASLTTNRAAYRGTTSGRVPAANPEHPPAAGTTFSPSSPTTNGKPGSHTSMKTPFAPRQHSDQVIESFQQTMQAFLEVQKSTMLAYLAGPGSAGSTLSPMARAGNDNHGESDAHVREPSARLNSGTAIARQESTRVDDGLAQIQPLEDLRAGIRPFRPSDTRGLMDPRNGKSPGSGSDIEPDSSAVPDRALITSRLLETVRDRTGYPLETLGLDLDMEADLGIDSIKRVEVLGKLRDEFPGLRGLSDTAETMDALARARTLGVIVDRMAALAEKINENAESPKTDERSLAATANGKSGQTHEPTSRRLLKAVEAPLPIEQLGLMEGGRIVITEDGCGVAECLAGQLQSAGVPVDRIGGENFPVEWTSPSAIESVLDELRSRGPLAGLIHVRPMGSRRAGEPTENGWSERARAEVRGLFLLAKAAAFDLENASRSGGSCLIAATALGGRFASAGSSSLEFSPYHGGVAGLVKTLRANGPRFAVAWSISQPERRLKRSRACWPPKSASATATPKSATNETAGSGCRPL